MTKKYDVTITTSEGEEVFFGIEHYPSVDGEFLRLDIRDSATLIRVDTILRIEISQYEI